MLDENKTETELCWIMALLSYLNQFFSHFATLTLNWIELNRVALQQDWMCMQFTSLINNLRYWNKGDLTWCKQRSLYLLWETKEILWRLLTNHLKINQRHRNTSIRPEILEKKKSSQTLKKGLLLLFALQCCPSSCLLFLNGADGISARTEILGQMFH